MASHWSAAGQVNGYLPKFWAVFLGPVIMAFVLACMYVLPLLDPFKENWPAFRKQYNLFIVAVTIFFSYLYWLMLAWNSGHTFEFKTAFLPAFAALLYLVGLLLPKLKRNWFVGIRTPWTISSDLVWTKTHVLGGVLFKISAILALIGLFFSSYGIVWLIAAPVTLSIVILLIYSYALYAKEHPHS